MTDAPRADDLSAGLAGWAARPQAEGLAEAACAGLLLATRGELGMAAPGARQVWSTALQSFQQPGEEHLTGPAGEPMADARQAAHTSGLVLQALDALEALPRHWPEALLQADPAEWLARLDWSRPREACAVAGLRLQWLVLRAETGAGPMAAGAARQAVRAALAWLDEAQDPATGLWGPPQGADSGEALLAAPDLLVFFEYLRWPVRHARQRVDLALERLEAAASPDGGPRAAASLAWLLASTYHAFNYRRDEVRAALAQLEAGARPADTGQTGGDVEAAWWRALTRGLAQSTAGDGGTAFARRPGPGALPRPRLSAHERQALPLWLSALPQPATRGQADTAAAISVVVPVFNLGRYLPEAVESVLAQTFQDFELIVVDDGSTDEYTRLLLEHWPWPRARLMRQANQGVAAARNNAIAAGAGRYVCCLDADDRLRPRFLEQAAAALEADPAVGLVTGAMQLFDATNRVLAFEACGLPALLVENCVMEPAVFRRTAWEQAGGYCGTFSVSGVEDWDLWLSIVEQGYRLSMLPEVVMDYRILPGSMSARMYQPEHWAQLMRELVARHAATYHRHLEDALGLHAQRKQALIGWADDRERARGWWEQQARNWENTAKRQAARIAELEAWIATLEEAKAWHDQQRQAWQAQAEAHARRVAELEAQRTGKEPRR
jgi:hypothetical protein